MRDSVLWRKIARIIMELASVLAISEERALDLFYSTKTYRQLSDPKYGLQLMLHCRKCLVGTSQRIVSPVRCMCKFSFD